LAAPPRDRPATRSRAAVATLAAAALILAFAGVFALGRASVRPGAPAATPTANIPPAWRPYQDPGGSFTLAIPAAWDVDRTTSTATIIYPEGTFEVPDIFTRFGPPATPAPPTSLSITIDVQRIISPAHRRALCASWHPNTVLAGLPAMEYQGLVRGWRIDTSAATYQIHYLPPGDLDNTERSTEPTPVPQDITIAVQEQLAEVIASFHPLPALAVSC
jgi:hypothetical protein